MPTRLWFDDNIFWDRGSSNPATPAYYAGWQEQNSALRTGLRLARPGNAFSNMSVQKNTAGAPKYCLHRVYVSDPLPIAFTLSGTVRGQMMCLEQLIGNDAMRAVVIRVWNSTTNTFRTPAVLVHLPTVLASEYPNVGTINHFFPPEVSITPVNVLKNDRIVVEIGTTFFNAGTGGTITAQLETGNPVGSDDLPIDESYTTPQRASWIEFSMDFPLGTPKSAGTVIRVAGGGVSPAGGADVLFELTGPDGARYDVTPAAAREGLSRVNLLIERNLHDFRAGDLTCTFDDGDGFFSELFRNIQPEDRWRLIVDRDRVRRFSGMIPGIDSIRFDRKQATCEVTALDVSKLLEDVPADGVARPADIYFLGADVAASATSITLNSTAGLYNGDSFSISDDAAEEEVTIALVTSGTVVQLTSPTSNAFTAINTTIRLTTPFFRFKTPDYLINALLDEASQFISGRSVTLNAPPSRLPIFSDMSTNRLGATTVPNAWTQHGGSHFARVGTASFEQTTPDADWTSVTDRKYIDWTPYRTQAQGEPSTFAAAPAAVVTLQNFGVDFTPGALVIYETRIVPGFAQQVELNKFTSADGITWSGRTFVTTLGDTGGVAMSDVGHDYDPTRNRVYYHWRSNLAGTQEFGYWNVAGAAKVILDTSDNRSGTSGGNIRYSAEAELLAVYNRTQNAIEFWRDSSIVLAYSGEFASSIDIKQTRFFNGAWYGVGYVRGIPSVVFSDDNWETATQIPLAGKPPTGAFQRHITIVNGTIRVVVNAAPFAGSTAQARMFVGASSFAGTIAYADFEGQSIINALDDLAILLNGVFTVDPDGVARFTLRALDSGAVLREIDDLITERADEPIWLEVYDYVEFVLPSGEIGAAGEKTSTSRNLSVQVQLVSSLPVATAAALYLLDFYQKRRQHSSVSMDDDGSVYAPLDPVRLDGVDWLVYSSSSDLFGYEVGLELIEKVT